MAQLNIAHFSEIAAADSRAFALLARDVAAQEVHGLEKSQVKANSVSVLVIPVDTAASLSGADTEVQVLVSGNDWPTNAGGEPATSKEAKVHFDALAQRIYQALAKQTEREVYVWVTPFTATGWAERE